MSLRRSARSARPTSTGRSHASQLETVIRERIKARLGRRIRNLAVAVDRGVIRLRGECSTFYSKQLAQHAVAGVVEDEVIDNGIDVAVPTPTQLT